MKKRKKTFSKFINTDFSLLFRGFIFIFIFCSLIEVIEISAQTEREPTNKNVMPPPSPSKTLPKPAKTPAKPAKVLDNTQITQPGKYAFVLEVDKNEIITIKVETTNGEPFNISPVSDFFARMGNQDPSKILAFENELMTAMVEIGENPAPTKKTLPAKKQAHQKLSFAEVIIKASPELSFRSIVKLAEGARKSTLQVKVKTPETGDDAFLYIPRMVLVEPNYKPPVRPNPLALVVQLRSNGSLNLNMEEQGTINNLTQLKTLLKKIFKEEKPMEFFVRTPMK